MLVLRRSPKLFVPNLTSAPIALTSSRQKSKFHPRSDGGPDAYSQDAIVNSKGTMSAPRGHGRRPQAVLAHQRAVFLSL